LDWLFVEDPERIRTAQFVVNRRPQGQRSWGTYKLGANVLTVGLNSLSTEASGTIVEAGAGGGLIKEGTLTLSGTDTYSGGTTILGGTLKIANGGTSGSIVGKVIDNAAVVVDRSDYVIFGGVIGGTGSLTQSGSGTLDLTAANTYSGNTNLSAGTLLVDGSQGASVVTVASGATLGGTGTIGVR
jgi:fibronectin-binding autotransporter adhesin